MTLTAKELTTLARVKAELDLELADTTHDDRLEDLIRDASELVVDYLDRGPIHYDTTTERITPRGSLLELKRVPVDAVVAVDVVTADGTVSSSMALNEIEVRSGMRGGLFRRGGWPQSNRVVELGGGPTPIPGTGGGDIAVTYAGGWKTPNYPTPSERDLPRAIERAVITTVCGWFNNPGGGGAGNASVSSEALLDYRVSYAVGSTSDAQKKANKGLSTDAAAMIEKWRDIR